MMIDTHCHLSNDDYPNLEEVIKHMGENYMIASGADMKYNYEVMDLIEKYSNVYGTIGLHPDEANNYSDSDIKYIEHHLLDKKIVGIGEIGLDYHFNENKEEQKELFIRQLDLARQYNKPVVVHSRDAALDTYNILLKYKDLKIVIHCFSYSYETAQNFINIGAKLGIGGVLTFKNARKLIDVVKNIPLDSIVLETDSPCLSPYRGEINEPYNITLVAEAIAKIKNISVADVYNSTTTTAKKIYSLGSD